MNRDFKSRLLALKAEFYARRQVEIGRHRPRLQPNGLPLVFVDGDTGGGVPAFIYSAAENGPPMRIGRLVANRIGRVLRVDDLYVFHDLDEAFYLPAIISYLTMEAGLLGLDRVELPGDDPAPPMHAA